MSSLSKNFDTPSKVRGSRIPKSYKTTKNYSNPIISYISALKAGKATSIPYLVERAEAIRVSKEEGIRCFH